MKCDRCGKFRTLEQVAGSDHGDARQEIVVECVWCMSEADRKRFEMSVPSPESEGKK